jgi:predicted transcriptional regulator
MSLKQKIVDLLNTNPGLDSNQITETLGAKVTSVKVTLCKLIGAERITRIKELKNDPDKPGRKNTYRYKVKTD